jgi:hypothetical protein
MFEEAELVLVHYRSALPTVVTLNSLFRHYPEAQVTLIDNSGGLCGVSDEVVPYVEGAAAEPRVLINPATDERRQGGRSHGGGLDFALENTEKKYLISMESDTFVTGRGGLELLMGLMAERYDWAGVGQKPIGDEFGSFSPSFAILRTDLLKTYGLSFKWRPRSPESYTSDDLIIRHHLLAAEQVDLGLPLTYPEGKPPDTYRRPREKLIETELQHVHYFDTAEYIHHFLKSKGYRYRLFRPHPMVCHIWGSRDEKLFLTHFREKFPDTDVNDFLPKSLKHASGAEDV